MDILVWFWPIPLLFIISYFVGILFLGVNPDLTETLLEKEEEKLSVFKITIIGFIFLICIIVFLTFLSFILALF